MRGGPQPVLLGAYDRLVSVCLAVAAAMIGIMTAMVSADVVLRSAGWGSLPFSVEVSEYILCLSTFLAAPAVLRLEGHVRVDVVVRALPPRLAARARTAADLIGLAVCIVLSVYGARAALEAFRLGTVVLKQLVVSEWWLLAVVPFTGLLLATEFLLRAAGLRRGPGGGRETRAGEGG